MAKQSSLDMSRLYLDIERLGQVFTPDYIVQKMLSLRRNSGRVLEPSSGLGAFLKYLERDAIGIELDVSLINDKRVIRCDFFAYPQDNLFDTIIGNPPYVRFNDIPHSTRSLLDLTWFDRRSNLYLFFIAKSIKHLKKGGELIFITPRNFLKATNSIKLNQALFMQGSFTHYYELGDEVVFRGYSPNCAIWRWEKGRKERTIETGKTFFCRNGQIWFSQADDNLGRLGDSFSVKVGAVSGADYIFTDHISGETDFVYSETAANGKTRKMIYNQKKSCLYRFKKELLARRIRRFNQSNWWQWGRNYHKSEEPRIYVNCKTRNPRPFFTHKATAYDGSLLALFPKYSLDLEKTIHKLNSVNWEDYGFLCGGRLLFSQRSLENAPIEI